MFQFFIVLSIFGHSLARPGEIEVQNVVTVPPNCPEGQEWINGACRDIWRSINQPENSQGANPLNMITSRPNCPPGQELINGSCRDVWRGGILAESESFQKLLEKLWAEHMQNFRQVDDSNVEATSTARNNDDDTSRNIITIPNQCPEGFKPDALGICRPQL